VSNYESSKGGQVSKDGIASVFAYGYDPTGRSGFLKVDRIHSFDPPPAEHSIFDNRSSLFQRFFFDQTGRLRPAAPPITN